MNDQSCGISENPWRRQPANGFTIIELAVVIVIIAALFYIATFREGAIVGTGIFFGGLALCAGLGAQKKGWRLAGFAFFIASVVAMGWMMQACSASMKEHAMMRKTAK